MLSAKYGNGDFSFLPLSTVLVQLFKMPSDECLLKLLFCAQMRQRGCNIRTERKSSARVHDIRSGAARVSRSALQEAAGRLLLIMLLTIDN